MSLWSSLQTEVPPLDDEEEEPPLSLLLPLLLLEPPSPLRDETPAGIDRNAKSEMKDRQSNMVPGILLSPSA